MRKKGFTLVEVLVSAMLLVAVMAGLSSIFVAVKRHIVLARSRVQALEFGKAKLESLTSEVRQDIWNSGNLSEGNKTGPSITLNNITYNISYSVSNVTGAATIRKVKLAVNWTEPIQ